MSPTTDKPRITRRGVPSRLLGDEALAARVSGGDEAAFEELFRRYHQPIYRFCAAMVGAEEAKDVLQNVMTKAMTSMPEERGFQPRPWLYRVARNECVDQLRRSSRTAPGLEADHRPDQSQRTQPERALEQRERMTQLVSDLAELPEKQRSALVMRELSGLGYDEIAAGLGSSEDGAKQLVYEARLALQQQDLGRSLDCAGVRELISARDRRKLRGRKIRAHLRSCEQCRSLDEAIGMRKAGMRSLLPPLPVGVAAGLLDALREGGAGTAGGVAAGGAVAGGSASGIFGVVGGSGIVAKGVVTAMVVGGIGAGAVGVTRERQGDKTPTKDGVSSEARSLEGTGAAGPGRGVVVIPSAGTRSAASKPDRFAAKRSDAARGTTPGRSGASSRGEDPVVAQAEPERIVPGRGQGHGPAELPAASSGGQARADEASSTVPGQTGAAPPSKKPSAPPGQSKVSSGPAVGAGQKTTESSGTGGSKQSGGKQTGRSSK